VMFMKEMKYIAIWTALVVGLPIWAQEPEVEPEPEPCVKPAIIERDADLAYKYPTELPYEWRGGLYSESGMYYDTVHVEDDCIPDTAFSLRLIVKEYIHMPEQTANLYPITTEYLWRGKLWPVQDTTYIDTAKTESFLEPDTIFSLKMYVKKYFEYAPELATLCQTQTPYHWRDSVFHATGTYKDTLVAPKFTTPDTIYTLKLKVGLPFEQSVYYKLCPGESVIYRGRLYDKEGNDTIALVSSTGCDSLYIVRVEIGVTSTHTMEEYLCTGDTFVWAKSTGLVTLTQPGYYFDSLKNSEGCDSVICLHLNYNNSYFRKDSLALCEDELPYQFGKQWLTESGTYYDTLQYGKATCFSVVQLNFTVLKNVHEEKTVQFCQGTGIRHNGGELFFDSRVYIDTLRSAGDGCYHIIRTVYTPGPTYIMEEWKHRSQDEPTYQWHGQTYTKDGTYSDRHLNQEGCDSVWILHLSTDYTMYADTFICSGDTIFYKSIQIGHDTTVVDSLVSSFGGDSVVYLHFTFLPRYYFKERTTICSNDYMPWPGHEKYILHEPGYYYDRLETKHGCDSIFEIYVTVNKAYSKDTLVTVSGYHAADELPYTWVDGHGIPHDLYNDTVIVDTMGHTPPKYKHDYKEGDTWYRALSGGCDSTTSIHFYVIRKYSFDTLYLCPNGKVIVDGRTYTETGDYEHWLAAYPWSTFRDSIHYFHIADAPNYYNDVWDIDTVCQNQLPYRWYHRICTAEGEYYDTLATQHGCDSIVKLKLFVKPSYNFYINETICEGDSFYINGRHITKSGIYVDSLVTQLGCDSVYKIVINVARSYHFDQTDYYNEGGSYLWHQNGQPWLLTKPGTYFDSCVTAANGCDSIYRLTLIEDKSYHFSDTVRICANELPYRWHNQIIYQSGLYHDSLSTRRGTDSIYSLLLSVQPKHLIERTMKVCPSEQLIINGKPITQSGTYVDSMVTAFGCDSIVLYHISFVTGYLIDEQKHMGPHEEVEWHGHIYTHSGVYFDSLRTENGCVSVYRLTLIADDNYYLYDTIRICRSETPYLWHGKYYYSSCDDAHPYISQFQMDSIHYLHLTVDPTYEIIRHEERCQGDHFVFNNQLITSTGEYLDTLHTQLGCDSVIRTIVNFHPNFYEKDTLYLIKGSSIVWHEQYIDQPGTYFYSATTAIGCDSIYQLTLFLADTFRMNEHITVCEEELPYRWHGQELMETGIYSDIRTSVHNADSCYYIYFTVAPKYETIQNATLCHGGNISYFGRTITQPGEYRDTLLSEYGCDSILILRVNWQAEKFTEQNIQLCYGQTYTINGKTYTQSGVYNDTVRTQDGCDSVIRYNIQVAPQYLYYEQKTIHSGSAYIWQGHLGNIPLTTAGVYTDSLVAQDGCDSVFILTLTVNATYLINEERHVCQDQLPYLWRGMYYETSGTYYDSLHSQQLADSVYCLILHVQDTTIRDRDYDFCSGEVAHIGNNAYRTSTYYYDTIYSEYGCPQITRHVIRFHPAYNIERTIHLDEGDSYQFFDTLITKPGVYRYKGKTIHGCDSIVKLTITFCVDKTPIDVHLKLCTGDTMQMGDTTITSPGIYERHYPNKYGCDSMVRYIVQAHNTFHWTSYASFCKNSSYTWYGHLNDTVINKPGKYEEYLRTIDGCDSVYTLILNGLPAYIHDTIIYRCKDEIPYTHKGQICYTNMTFYDTLRSTGGCDSVDITRYILNDHCSDWDFYTRCEGDELIVDNRVIENDGEHRFQIGADSVHRFNVLSYRVYNYDVHLNSYCDSVVYEGETYYARGAGKETFTVDRYLQSIHGCDSVEHVTMTIYQSAQNIPHTERIYDYGAVLFGGQLYNKPGTYVHKYHTWHGCDSTMVLNLEVIPTDSSGAKHFHYCYTSDKSLEIFGKFYHPAKDTIIFDTTAIPNVGMYIIQKAMVRVTYPFTITSLAVDTEVCSSENIYFNINFHYQGSCPVHYKLQFEPSELSTKPQSQEGDLDNDTSIVVAMSGGGLCVPPGEYPYSISFFAEDCEMSNTTLRSSIFVHYPNSIMEANWTDMIALVNANYNAGRWEFMPPYDWQVKNESGMDKTALVAPNASLPYLYTSYLEPGDRVTVSMLRKGYSKAVSSCEYIFYPVGSSNKIPILVYPTAARKASLVTIESSVDGQYILYNNAGQAIDHGLFMDGKQNISMPAVEGAYILYLQPKNEGIQVRKIVVY